MFFTTKAAINLNDVIEKLDDLISAVNGDINNYWPGIIIATIGILGNIVATLIGNHNSKKAREQEMKIINDTRFHDYYIKSFDIIQTLRSKVNGYVHDVYNLIRFIETDTQPTNNFDEIINMHNKYMKEFPDLLLELNKYLNMLIIKNHGNYIKKIKSKNSILMTVLSGKTETKFNEEIKITEGEKAPKNKIYDDKDILLEEIEALSKNITSSYINLVSQ